MKAVSIELLFSKWRCHIIASPWGLSCLISSETRGWATGQFLHKITFCLFCQQVIRLVLSRGVLVAPSPVFLVFVVVVLIDRVRVPMVTCVAEVACSHRPRSGAVGIGRSTLTRNAMLCARLLPLLASLRWLCPKVIIFFNVSLFSKHWMMNIVFPVFLNFMNEPMSPWHVVYSFSLLLP